MALIKVTDIAYGRLRSPDLDVAEEFLTRFGMVRAERTASASSGTISPRAQISTRRPPYPAPSITAHSPRPLSSVSRYSVSGSESATMPPPT